MPRRRTTKLFRHLAKMQAVKTRRKYSDVNIKILECYHRVKGSPLFITWVSGPSEENLAKFPKTLACYAT